MSAATKRTSERVSKFGGGGWKRVKSPKDIHVCRVRRNRNGETTMLGIRRNNRPEYVGGWVAGGGLFRRQRSGGASGAFVASRVEIHIYKLEPLQDTYWTCMRMFVSADSLPPSQQCVVVPWFCIFSVTFRQTSTVAAENKHSTHRHFFCFINRVFLNTYVWSGHDCWCTDGSLTLIHSSRQSQGTRNF